VIDLLRARRIHLSDLVPEGQAYVADLPDEREPGAFVSREVGGFEMCPINGMPRRKREFVFERPTVATLIVNPRTMGLAPLARTAITDKEKS